MPRRSPIPRTLRRPLHDERGRRLPPYTRGDETETGGSSKVTDGLQAQYTFESQNFDDATDNNYHGTGAPDGGYTFEDDPERGAVVRFANPSGSNDTEGYFDYETPADFGITDSYSVVGWFRPQQFDDWEALSMLNTVELDIRSGSLRFFEYDGGLQWRCSVTATDYMTTDNWYLIAGTMGPNGAELYIDGNKVDSVSSTNWTWTDDGSPFRAGYHRTGNDGGSNSHYLGRSDDVRVYNTRLSDSQISSIYSNTSQ